jgi:hypothetical protein
MVRFPPVHWVSNVTRQLRLLCDHQRHVAGVVPICSPSKFWGNTCWNREQTCETGRRPGPCSVGQRSRTSRAADRGNLLNAPLFSHRTRQIRFTTAFARAGWRRDGRHPRDLEYDGEIVVRCSDSTARRAQRGMRAVRTRAERDARSQDARREVARKHRRPARQGEPATRCPRGSRSAFAPSRRCGRFDPAGRIRGLRGGVRLHGTGFGRVWQK